MFRIEMLPAEHGDAISGRVRVNNNAASNADRRWSHQRLRGRAQARFDRGNEPHGRTSICSSSRTSIRITSTAPSCCFATSRSSIRFGDIWFNAWEQLAPEPLGDTYGPEQGEFVSQP